MRKRIISIVSVLMVLMLIITGCATGSADNIGSNTSGVTESTTENDGTVIDEDGTYDSKDEVALYIETYGHLPSNYITKKEAQALGWEGGSLEPYAPGKMYRRDAFRQLRRTFAGGRRKRIYRM